MRHPPVVLFVPAFNEDLLTLASMIASQAYSHSRLSRDEYENAYFSAAHVAFAWEETLSNDSLRTMLLVLREHVKFV